MARAFQLANATEEGARVWWEQMNRELEPFYSDPALATDKDGRPREMIYWNGEAVSLKGLRLKLTEHLGASLHT